MAGRKIEGWKRGSVGCGKNAAQRPSYELISNYDTAVGAKKNTASATRRFIFARKFPSLVFANPATLSFGHKFCNLPGEPAVLTPFGYLLRLSIPPTVSADFFPVFISSSFFIFRSMPPAEQTTLSARRRERSVSWC